LCVCTYVCVCDRGTTTPTKFRLIDLEIPHTVAALSLTHKVAGPNTMMTIAMCNRINLLVFVNYERMEIRVEIWRAENVGGGGGDVCGVKLAVPAVTSAATYRLLNQS
jgi:hypothetical protein